MAAKYAKDMPVGFTNRIEKVAIVGAGGTVGKYMTEELLKTGKHTVTAITRQGSTNKLPEGVRVARVDYADEASLAEALRGQEFLIITMNATAPPDTQVKLVRAAAAAGVRWVMPNFYGPDFKSEGLERDVAGLWRTPRAVIAEAAALGVSSWVVMSCGFWYQFSLAGSPDRFGFDLARREVTLFDDGEAKMNVSTWEQCGRAAAALLSLPELPADEADGATTLARWRDDVLYVSSFLVSQRDMLASLRRVTGTGEAEWTVKREGAAERWREGQEAMRKGDRKGFVRQMYSRVFYPGDGDFGARRGLANEALGLPVEDLDEATAEAVKLAESGALELY